MSKLSAAQGSPKTILHVEQPMTGEVAVTGWWEVEFGEHDWHQPDPLKNSLCRRCGLYTGRDSGDGCPENPTRQRLHQVGPWEPVEATS